MATVVAHIKAQIESDFDSKGTDASKRAFQEIADAASRAAAVMGGVLVAGAKTAIDAASDQQAAFQGLEKVYGDAAGGMQEWAKEQKKFGISAADAATSANQMGAMLQSSGFSAKESAQTVQELTERAADLGAAFGISATESLDKFGAAIRGERDGVEALGISIKQADVDARVLADGNAELEGAAKKTAEAQATLSLIMEQSAGAAGLATETGDQYAQSSEQLRATITNLAADIGSQLLPHVEDAVLAVQEFLETNTNLVPIILRVAAGMAAFVGIVSVARGVMIAYRTAVAAYHVAVTIAAAATKIWTAVTWAFNAAMRANPIGIIITAITALVAVIVLVANRTKHIWMPVLQQVWDWVKKVGGIIGGWFRGVWDSLSATVSKVAGAIKSAWQSAVTTVTNLFTRLRTAAITVKNAISSAFDSIKSAVSGAIDSVISRIQSVLDWFERLADKARNALSNLNPFKRSSSPAPSASAATRSVATAAATPMAAVGTLAARSVGISAGRAVSDLEKIEKRLDRLTRKRELTLRVNVVGTTGRAQRLLAEGIIA